MMRRKRRYSKIKIILFLFILFFIGWAMHKGWEYYQLQSQMNEAVRIRDELLQENRELQEKKKDLQDPNVVEKKARNELGLVKPGEVPYVQ